MKKALVSILVILGLIAGVVLALCLKKNKNGNNPGTIFVTTEGGTEYTVAGEYIRIEAFDGSYHVGTRLLLQYSASSETLAEGIIWKSSDESVVTVTGSGEAEIVGEGIAIITITSGVYSDSLVVQGIGADKETEIFETEAPQVPTTENNIPDSTTGNSEDKPTDGPVEKPTEPATTKPVEKPTEPATTKPVEKPTEPATTKPVEKPTEPVTTKPTENPTVPPTAKPTEPVTQKPDYKQMLLETLPVLGYAKHLEDVYLYKEDGNYLGEVIVNDDSLQIYVQTRTTKFDAALKELLKVVLPKEYNNVYVAFVQADTNKTIVAEGHTIRIRPAGDENHAQLIISY